MLARSTQVEKERHHADPRPAILESLGLTGDLHALSYRDADAQAGGELLESLNPATGEVLGTVREATVDDYERVVSSTSERFREWRMLPAPQRGEIVRQIGNVLREHKADLGALVSLEMGKIRPEGEGEVQEAIDIADFAVGLSRQLYGLTMHSERPGHRMYEQWHPLGNVGRDQRVQFPGRRLGVELGADRARLRQRDALWKPSQQDAFDRPIASHAASLRLRAAGRLLALIRRSSASDHRSRFDDRRRRS